MSEEKKPAVPRLSDDELREFIDAFVSGRIFTSNHVPEGAGDMIAMVFMPIAFGAITKEIAEETALVYEYIDKAGPRSINGMPIFFSCRLLHKDDWERALPALRAERDRRKNIELPPRQERAGDE
jgi:hypothetical protein